jgi:hypothetical protein
MSYHNCIKEYVKNMPLDHLTQPVGDELGPRLVPSMTSQVLHQPNYWIAEAQPRLHIFTPPTLFYFCTLPGFYDFSFSILITCPSSDAQKAPKNDLTIGRSQEFICLGSNIHEA